MLVKNHSKADKSHYYSLSLAFYVVAEVGMCVIFNYQSYDVVQSVTDILSEIFDVVYFILCFFISSWLIRFCQITAGLAWALFGTIWMAVRMRGQDFFVGVNKGAKEFYAVKNEWGKDFLSWKRRGITFTKKIRKKDMEISGKQWLSRQEKRKR